ncbi:alpha/beta hydrolase [Nocardia implantans]|uniref:Alpha/beta hydrolase n=1 Tax=Nocardia implantans TaxID=3108168 RepID=A0ABU6B2B0_9NOCA|nr:MULTISPECIES: alpha/beta hydrolase [unclassified Nocardia]MBF6195014.1 alpha/beta hydrolase [Nocardia beijingensis]MEA3530325.1 alpha/beta hydrolase [Nocardia sp. CDC192]MEB3513815.1 alpha/beta hydrolase [Nocardia sp. CDC186]
MRDIDLPLPLARAVLNPIFRATLNKRLPFTLQRRLLDVSSRAQLLPAGAVVRPTRLGGRPAERIDFAKTCEHGAVLYLHGGGYAVGSLATHRSLAARLARDVGCPVYVLDYRLAPEHPLPAALDDAEAAFLELVATGLRPDRIAVSGDSAGGGLSLALAQRLIARHGQTPAALGLIAPWADPNEIPDRERDLVISKPWSRACAAAYLGDGDAADPVYAPLTGELRGLPPTYVQVDVSELLHRQCVALVAALRAAGVQVRFTESEGLWHVAQLQAALAAPAAAVLRELAEFLREAVQPADLRELG